MQTRRLILRQPVWEDLPDTHRLGSSPEVMRYLRKNGVQDAEESHQELKYRIAQSIHALGYWVVETGKEASFVGWLALRYMENSREVELGFRLGPDFWGQGFATEAGKRVLWYGFRELELSRIWAVVMPENLASVRVLEKLGFQATSFGRYYGLDCLLLSLEKKDFIRQQCGFQL